MIPRFSSTDGRAKAHFEEHGFVVLTDVFDPAELDAVRDGWRGVVREAASAAGMSEAELVVRFPQHRDLWRKGATFHDLLRGGRQARVAAALLGVRGVRLFHDHAISKPAGRSGTIPWHQDSSYWPLDRVGISLWTPVDDVPEDGGCLKLLDRSHHDGPGAPQDFLAAASVDRDADPRLVRVPVRRGETVVLGGLTWHGSDPNIGGPERLAYLTLWVPATSRFVPEHAGWHPTAAHIQVAPGERLDGEWFPLFGELAEDDEGEPVAFPAPANSGGPTMFTASRDIGAQLAWLLGCERRALAEMLDGSGQDMVVARATALGLVADERADELRRILDDLVLQERVRTTSTARDVYLGTVVAWWRLVGTRLEELRRAA